MLRIEWGHGSYQWNYNLAIRVRLKVVRLFQLLPQNTVVVDLAVDRKRDGLIIVNERLSAALYRNISTGRVVSRSQKRIPTPTILKRS